MHRFTKAGEVQRWLLGHCNYKGDGCLIWPFAKNWNGYGSVQFNDKMTKAHRAMCELAHGAPPTPGHVAAHSCHNPPCVNPGHLDWKTPRENQLDRRKNGTSHRRSIWSRTIKKLTPAQEGEVRLLKGKMNQRQIGEKFGISYQQVSLIQRGLDRQPKRQSRA